MAHVDKDAEIERLRATIRVGDHTAEFNRLLLGGRIASLEAQLEAFKIAAKLVEKCAIDRRSTGDTVITTVAYQSLVSALRAAE